MDLNKPSLYKDPIQKKLGFQFKVKNGFLNGAFLIFQGMADFSVAPMEEPPPNVTCSKSVSLHQERFQPIKIFEMMIKKLIKMFNFQTIQCTFLVILFLQKLLTSQKKGRKTSVSRLLNSFMAHCHCAALPHAAMAAEKQKALRHTVPKS